MIQMVIASVASDLNCFLFFSLRVLLVCILFFLIFIWNRSQGLKQLVQNAQMNVPSNSSIWIWFDRFGFKSVRNFCFGGEYERRLFSFFCYFLEFQFFVFLLFCFCFHVWLFNFQFFFVILFLFPFSFVLALEKW